MNQWYSLPCGPTPAALGHQDRQCDAHSRRVCYPLRPGRRAAAPYAGAIRRARRCVQCRVRLRAPGALLLATIEPLAGSTAYTAPELLADPAISATFASDVCEDAAMTSNLQFCSLRCFLAFIQIRIRSRPLVPLLWPHRRVGR